MSTGITLKVCSTDERAVLLQKLWGMTRTALELSKGQPVYATVDLHDKRSNAQNRMFWALWTDIAIGMGLLTKGKHTYTKRQAHNRVLQDICGVEREMIGGVEVISTVQTSKMTKAEAAHVIGLALEWAADRNITVMMPDDYLAWSAE